MQAYSFELNPQTPAQAVNGFGADQLRILNMLRILAMECRVAARTDIHQACSLLSMNEAAAQDAHARSLIQCIGQATGKRPVFFRVGEAELSFDETWLLRAISSSQQEDWDSFEFLIRSRIPFSYRRTIAFLIHGIAERFSLV